MGIESLAKRLREVGIAAYLFANDLSILCELENSLDTCQIERALKISEEWTNEHLLFFNTDKTVYMTLGACKISDLNISLYGKSLQRAKKAKLLGLTLDAGKYDPFASARLSNKNWF